MYLEVFTLDNYIKFFKDEFYQNVLWRTLWVSAVTTILCLIGGIGVAYYMARTSSRLLQRYLIIAIVLPLFMGNVARTAGWIIILNDGGVVNYVLQALGLTGEPLHFLYTSGAVITGLTSVLLPYMIVTLNSVMHNIDISLEEASLNLGASALNTFRRIVLPLMAPEFCRFGALLHSVDERLCDADPAGWTEILHDGADDLWPDVGQHELAVRLGDRLHPDRIDHDP